MLKLSSENILLDGEEDKRNEWAPCSHLNQRKPVGETEEQEGESRKVVKVQSPRKIRIFLCESSRAEGR